MAHETGVGSGTIHYQDQLFATCDEARAWAAVEAQRRIAERKARDERGYANKKKNRYGPTKEAREIWRLKRGLENCRAKERARILALLRSEPAISMMDRFSREWADWLEAELAKAERGEDD